MKKILLLGGSAQQVVAIETAKRLGYETILCDFLTDNPGQYVADKFYLISTTDKEAVLGIAREERVDGVLAYASDPAAPTAAYVAEALNLPTNPYESVEILCHKDRFRHFLRENGFFSPQSCSCESTDAALTALDNFSFPIMVKPVDSSGSKGVTVLYDRTDTIKAKKAFELAFFYSRCNRVVLEEYIERKHCYLIGGDIFVLKGKIVQWGLLNCHRDSAVNTLVPVGKSYPVLLDEGDILQVKYTLQRIIDLLHINAGAMNVELIIDEQDRIWPLDIGPRSGGNMIPELLSYIFHNNVVEMCVKVAMGQELNINIKDQKETIYYATHNLHSACDGKFVGVRYSEEIKPYIVQECLYKNLGDPVQYFDDASKVIGIIFMHFDSSETMFNILNNIEKHIIVDIVVDNKDCNK